MIKHQFEIPFFRNKCVRRQCPKLNSRLSTAKEDEIQQDEDHSCTENTENDIFDPIPSQSNTMKEVSNENVTEFIVKIVENLINAALEKNVDMNVALKKKEKRYACNVCGKLFAQFVTSKKHCLVNKPADQSVMCTICGKILKRKRNLKRHITNVHAPNKSFKPPVNARTVPIKCEDCGKEYSAKNKLAEHMQRKHGLAKNGGPLFNCTECKFSHYSESRVKAHFTVNHIAQEINSFNCSICKISYKSASGIQKHNKTVHSTLTSTLTSLPSMPDAYIVAKKSQPPSTDNTQTEESLDGSAMVVTSSPKVGNTPQNTSGITMALDNSFPCASERNMNMNSTRASDQHADSVLEDFQFQFGSGSIITESGLSYLQL